MSKTSPNDKLKSAGKKIIQISKAQCSDFSLAQRNGTCFMAASTLLFARAALKSCKALDVRQFVRRSMANAWDDAQGPNTDGLCPRIPKIIRQYYAALSMDITELSTGWALKKYDHTMLNACVSTRSCTEKTLMKGGYADMFLVALFWASDPSSCVFISQKVYVKDCVVKYPYMRGYNRQLQELVSGIILKNCKKVFEKWTVLSVYQISDCVIDEESLSSGFEASKTQGVRVYGVLLHMYSTSRTMGHVLSAYPCYSGGVLKWILCNSWGDACSRSFKDTFHKLREERKYDSVTQLTFLEN